MTPFQGFLATALLFFCCGYPPVSAREVGRHRGSRHKHGASQRSSPRARSRRAGGTGGRRLQAEDNVNAATSILNAVEMRDPEDLFVEIIDRAGDNPAVDSAIELSRLTHVGCFENPPALGFIRTYFTEEVGPADPWECWQKCANLTHDDYPDYDPKELSVAVKRSICSCIPDGCLDQLNLVESDQCTEYCKFYQNPICGGEPYFYGVFKPYDSLAMSAQGAYDSFRFIWFSIVYVKTVSTLGCNAALPPGDLPDRYHLHAVHANTGEPLFPYQLKLPGILYGIQNDLLSNRLVGLYTSERTGRTILNADWEYSLAVIDINTTVRTYPKMLPTYFKMRWIEGTEGQFNPLTHLGFSPASALLSSVFNVYIFILPDPSLYLRFMKDTVYIVSVEGGELIDFGQGSITMDFKLMQLFANEKSGIVSGIGPREWVEQGFTKQEQVYVELGRVYECAGITPCVNWVWTSFQPKYLASTVETGHFKLYPGICANDHLQNKSYIAYRNIPEEDIEAANIGIFEASLVFGVDSHFWCSEGECQGTLPQEAAYAALYNREPGIPLSLKAPTMLTARFSLNADYILVLWDRATHMGAKPYEKLSGGYVFPECPTDFVSEMVGEFDCAMLFQEGTIELLGEFNGTRCEWTKSEEVRIWLPRDFNISVGDTLYILDDTVFATSICRAGVPPEFSPGATGGVQVLQPADLVPPLITTTGATSIDACSDLELSVDAEYTGGVNVFTWTFVPNETNPEDTSQTFGREFDLELVAEIEVEVGYATGNNSNYLRVTSHLIEPQALYHISACVLGRWGLETCMYYEVMKANIPIPTVEINGPEIIYVNRPVLNTLSANAQKSICAAAGSGLGFQWTEPSGWMQPFPPPRFADVSTTNPDLNLPPYILETDPYSFFGYKEYIFRIMVYPITSQGFADMQAAVTDTVIVRVEQSELLVVFTPAHKTQTIGVDLFLDASCSADPDDEASGGLDCTLVFNGLFSWACQTPDYGSGRQPCYGLDPALPEPIDNCRYDTSQVSLPPVFEGKPYCRYGQGVLAFNTSVGFEPGDYLFTVTIKHEDGRTATGSTNVSMTYVWLPTFVCSYIEPMAKFPITEEIGLTCTETGTKLQTQAERIHVFKFCKMEANPAYDQQSAFQDPDDPITIDPQICTPQPQFDVTDPSRFEFNEVFPNLIIRANVLEDSTTYRLTLETDLIENGESILPPGLVGSTSLDLVTAGGPPRLGTLEVDPMNATCYSTRRMEARDWVAETDEGSLTYQFGYVSAELADIPLNSPTSQEFLVTDEILVTDPATLETIVFVDICTAYGACTHATRLVFCTPVENSTSLLEELMIELELSTPPESASISGKILALRRDEPDAPSTPAGEEDYYRATTMVAMAEDVPFVYDLPDVILQMIANLETETLMCYASGSGPQYALALYEDVFDVVLGNPHLYDVVSLSNQLFNIQAKLMVPTICANSPTGAGANAQSTGGFGMRLPASSQSIGLEGQGFLSGTRRLGQDAATAQSEKAERLASLAMLRRLPINHPRPSGSNMGPRGNGGIIDFCPSAFCDVVGLYCIAKERTRWSQREQYRCCDVQNPRTMCSEPPCWFLGARCPKVERRIGKKASKRAQPFVDLQNTRESWFDSWRMFQTPHQRLTIHDVSEWDRHHGYHEWHPRGNKRRRLQADAVVIDGSDTLTPEQIVGIRNLESPELQSSRIMVTEAKEAEMEEIFYFSQEMISYNAYSPSIADQLRKEARAREAEKYAYQIESERNDSQRITRTNVLRDTLAKFLIPDMIPGASPMIIDNTVYTMWIGKHPNMSAAMPGIFTFPNDFERPPDSPDEPTASNNRTGFSFIFIDYKQDPYSWSTSKPASNFTKVVTLMVMKADPNAGMDAEVDLNGEPIRMFADFILYGNTMCMFWDRFFPGTPGGAWSITGVASDDQGCITSLLNIDIGVFMDGHVPESDTLVEGASGWAREVWADNCIGCDNSLNLFILAVLGMVVFVNMLFILLGYVLDESTRSYMKSSKVASRYWCEGDGVSDRLHVDDPIAYSVRDNLVALWIGTFINVTFREHAIVSVLLYRETFTRPQRLWCFGVMITGVLAINAAVNSTPGYVQLESAWVVSGALSGFFVYPIYAILLLMFNMRPHPAKKRIVKKQYDKTEVESMRRQRDAAADRSALKLPADQRARQAALPEGPVHDPGANRLMGVAAPLPLPPMPANVPGGTLAKLPPLDALQMRGLPKMLALPALQQPGVSAFMPLPPPPKHPPPPKSGVTAAPQDMMPPTRFPKNRPPPQPFPALPPLQDAGRSVIGAMTAASNALPLLPPPDTGATPEDSALPPQPLPPQGLDVSQGADTLAPMPGQMAIAEDPKHNMAPPSLDLGGKPENDEMGPSATGPPTSFTPPGTPGGAARAHAVPSGPGTPGGAARAHAVPSGDPSNYARPQEPTTPSGTPTPSQGGMGGTGGFSYPGDATPASQATPRSVATGQGIAAPPPQSLVQMASGPMPLYVRAAPPSEMPAPYAPAPTGPDGIQSWLPPGMPPPGMGAPVPTAKGPGPPVRFPTSLVPPPPPPPPREDEQEFIRRIRLNYLDKVIREGERGRLLEDYEELSKPVPTWIFDVLTSLPYVACCAFMVVSIFIVIHYGMQFATTQESNWTKSSIVGIGLILGLLELFRVLMLTLVELRKFETRKKSISGYFNVRRVHREGEANARPKDAPPPKLSKKDFVAAQVPKAARQRTEAPVKAEGGRPSVFARGLPGPPPAPRLPVGKMLPPAPPPPNFAFSQRAHFAAGQGPPAPPPLPGNRTPAGFDQSFVSQSSGGLDRSFGTASAGASLHQQVHILNQQVRANSHSTAPPPPSQSRANPSAGDVPRAPPPAPTEAPPIYSRPPSRPSSAGSTPQAAAFGKRPPS